MCLKTKRVWISKIRALSPNCPKTEHFILKNVQNPNVLSHLGLLTFRRTSENIQNSNEIVWILDAVRIPNDLEMDQKLIIPNPTVFQTFTVSICVTYYMI